MVYSSGAKILPDIMDEISNGLINTGLWHNVDTTWNTTDKTGNNARRVIAYGTAGASGKGNTTLSSAVAAGVTVIPVTSEVNFNVGDKVVIGSGSIAEVREITAVAAGSLTINAAINTAHAVGEAVRELDLEIYLALECINIVSGYNVWDGAWYAKGLRVTFSASWDVAAHNYPSANQQSFVMYEKKSNGGVAADMAVLLNTYYLWYEANGFVIMGKPEPNATDDQQNSFLAVVERNPNKEYADGYTNFFLYNVVNEYNFHRQGWGSYRQLHNVLRPFAFEQPDETWNGYNYNGTTRASENFGIVFPSIANKAFKSTGNGKVYYSKPIIQNQKNAVTPIFQSELFFPFDEGVGLIDGDVVAVEGSTTKFLCKALDSPDILNRLTYAIKYVA